MTRSLWSTGHRRGGVEAPQSRPGPSRPAPGRHRGTYQRRAPFPAIDERPSDRPALNHPAGLANRGEAFVVPTIDSCDVAAERQRQSELARIRAEIMGIAREVAKLRRQEAVGLSGDTMSAHSPNAGRLPGPRQASSENRDHRLAERPRGIMRPGAVNKTAPATPVRERWPLLAIGDEALNSPPALPKAPAGLKAAASKQNSIASTASRGAGLATRAALFAALVLAGTTAIAFVLQGKWAFLAYEPQKTSRLFADAPASPTDAMLAKLGQPQLTSAADHTSALYPFEMPDTYGVYAVGEGQLTALEPLAVRIPDARVAVSSTVTKPAPAPATNGTPLFVVYHRELATSVPESASVRVFAKVMQETTFAGGKPRQTAVEDTWAVRGGAINMRIAPVAANKEMILIRPADPNFTLSPGRYVLMFKNQAYDFSVGGTVTDVAHCLERSDLQDRSVYSECRELPAAIAKS